MNPDRSVCVGGGIMNPDCSVCVEGQPAEEVLTLLHGVLMATERKCCDCTLLHRMA